MKNKLILFLFCTSLVLSVSCKKDASKNAETKDAVEAAKATAEATRYTVDTNTSIINWTGSKPTGKHTGTLNIAQGEVYVKDMNIQSGKFTIDMKSITVTDLKAGDGKEDLEGHLKGLAKDDSADHFFNTTKYPVGTFEITSVKNEGGKSMVEGNLTLKGITKSVKFPAVISIADVEVKLESEPFKIDRTLWNINYSSKSVFDNLGDKYVDDEIEIVVKIKAYKA